MPDCHVDTIKDYYDYGQTFKLGTSIDNYLNNPAHSGMSIDDIIVAIKKNARGETLEPKELQALNAIDPKDSNNWNYTSKCYLLSNCIYNAQNYCYQNYREYDSLTSVALDNYKTELNNKISRQYKKYEDAYNQMNGALSFEQSNAKATLDAAVAVITNYSDLTWSDSKGVIKDRLDDTAKNLNGLFGVNGETSYEETDMEKAKKFFNSENKSKISSMISDMEPSYKNRSTGIVSLDFGMDADGNITFQDRAVRTIYNSFVNSVKEKLHDTSYKFSFIDNLSDDMINKLVQSAWITTYNNHNSSEYREYGANAFVNDLLTNFKALMEKICDNPKLLELYTAHTAYANTKLLNGVDNYNNDPISYKYKENDGEITLTSGEDDNKYQDAMYQLLQNLINTYGKYGISKSVIKEIFQNAQKMALDIFEGNTPDCPAGCSCGNRMSSDWTSEDGDLHHVVDSYGFHGPRTHEEYAENFAKYWSNSSRKGDRSNCTMQELIQEILYCFDKLIYKKAAEGNIEVTNTLSDNMRKQTTSNGILATEGKSMLAQANQQSGNIQSLLENDTLNQVVSLDRSSLTSSESNNNSMDIKIGYTGNNPLIIALYANFGSTVAKYITENDTDNPTYQAIIQDAAIKVAKGELTQDTVVDYIVSQIKEKISQIVPDSILNPSKNNRTNTGNNSGGSEKADNGSTGGTKKKRGLDLGATNNDLPATDLTLIDALDTPSSNDTTPTDTNTAIQKLGSYSFKLCDVKNGEDNEIEETDATLNQKTSIPVSGKDGNSGANGIYYISLSNAVENAKSVIANNISNIAKALNSHTNDTSVQAKINKARDKADNYYFKVLDKIEETLEEKSTYDGKLHGENCKGTVELDANTKENYEYYEVQSQENNNQDSRGLTRKEEGSSTSTGITAILSDEGSNGYAIYCNIAKVFEKILEFANLTSADLATFS